jgi:ABC-type lipoprotein export system ATPase subunit
MQTAASSAIEELKIRELLEKYPFVKDYFDAFGLDDYADYQEKTFCEYIEYLSEDFLEENGLEKGALLESITDLLDTMETEEQEDVNSITIYGGKDKFGNPENIKLNINKGEVVCIVGPTGSGKSRLLADIEWVAQKDTPTGRLVHINGDKPDKKWRFSIEHKLVAQLSQNMNFVMDLTVEEFVKMHAESRLVENPDIKVDEVFNLANELAGEPFERDTQITSLSGGQSRALMIADTAVLSKSPIVLIDEIENAGIDRQKALNLLVKKEKIVLMATHDPILALLGNKRLVIKNGGISKIIEVDDTERRLLPKLREIDNKLLEYRNRLRNGEILDGVN